MTKNELSILIVDDEAEYRKVLKLILEQKGYRTAAADSFDSALEMLAQYPADIVLTDMIMGEKDGLELLQAVKNLYPEVEVILITGYGSYATAVQAIKLGAFSYFSKGSDPKELLAEIKKIEKMKTIHTASSQTLTNPPLLITKNKKVQDIFDLIEKIAPTDITVLLLGESGAGKEIFARHLRNKSLRSNQPYISVNCAALPKSLLESELFGYEKGAFTGAAATHIGRFEAADKGTLFIDEIGEIDLETQVELLRVLETKIIERVGSNTPIPLDTRLVMATNRDLQKEVEQNHFRKDLFYRINTITIEIPPLRERKEDILLFADYFMRNFAAKYGKTITGFEAEVRTYLEHYHFPGNVRELRNMMERLVVLAEGDTLMFKDLPQPQEKTADSIFSKDYTLKALRQETEKKYISELLQKYAGNLNDIADHLGITRRHLLNLLRDLEIEY